MAAPNLTFTIDKTEVWTSKMTIFVEVQNSDKGARVIATNAVEVTATNRMAQHATVRYFTCFEMLTVTLRKLPVVTCQKKIMERALPSRLGVRSWRKVSVRCIYAMRVWCEVLCLFILTFDFVMAKMLVYNVGRLKPNQEDVNSWQKQIVAVMVVNLKKRWTSKR